MRMFYKEEAGIQWLFNRERLILSATQDTGHLQMMLESREGGLYSSEVSERRWLYGSNLLSVPSFRRRTGVKTMKGHELSAYLEEMLGQRICVVRQGIEPYAELDGTRLVPGDVVFISEGDIVPADIRLVRADGVLLDQHLLTGTMEQVRRTAAVADGSCASLPVTSIGNICLAGSVVVEGMGKGLVVSTGPATYLGKIIYGY